MNERFINSLPVNAQKQVQGLLHSEPVEIVLRRDRKTKWGDFRYHPKHETSTITLNEGLLPEAMLLTFLHEYSHFLTVLRYGTRVRPHGPEWKRIFQEILSSFQGEEIWGNELDRSLRKYSKNPSATVNTNPILYAQLIDRKTNESVMLNLLSFQDHFEFNERTFVLLKKRRTRFVCRDTNTKKDYLFRSATLVKPIQKSKHE